ncbi:MAG: TPM domain-containing protein [Luteolibacter sp.]|uniref:TPM domain-containing protein n=1 Tax=Luteolibacter sp. TaxID=1962973 RepID=UPI0032638C4E
MNVKTVIFLLAILLAVPVSANSQGAFEYGPRPALSVFDPDEFLDPAVVKEIAEPLAKNFKEENVDVIVVVLKDTGSAPPEHVARQFAEAWCRSQIHCVVLHVPGNPNSPWIIPAGQIIDHIRPENVEQDVNDRQRRARAEPDEAHKVKAAASESADMLRYWMKNAINHTEMLQTATTQFRLEQETNARKKQIALLATLAAILPIIAGITVCIGILRRRGPAFFPNHLWRLRLGAPHAGGNHAVSNLGPPLP